MNSILFLMLTIGQASYVANTAGAGSFPLVQGQQTATLYVDSADWPGVVRAVGDLQADIERVTNQEAGHHGRQQGPGAQHGDHRHGREESRSSTN